jgi:hypothetical protein
VISITLNSNTTYVVFVISITLIVTQLM